MKIFWLNDSLCLEVENDAERNALELVRTMLLQITEVQREQAAWPGLCPELNPVENTRVSVAHEARSICNSLTRMQSLLSVHDPVANMFGSR